MGQEIFGRRSAPTLRFLHRVFESAGFCVAVSDHPVLLKNQPDVIVIGTPQPILQSQTVATDFHMASSSVLDKLRLKRQVIRIDRVVAVFPIHTDHAEQSC